MKIYINEMIITLRKNISIMIFKIKHYIVGKIKKMELLLLFALMKINQ